ncbi:MAG: LPS export ABC transporter periplasmic protein LptC [Betaproteobacteria bacterium]|jgi:lipopolysaccharide export system protein LptC|nr:LPS export ABC transporter periplasmic protein LptC [Betaproteobacteria bacterium]MBK7744519.1 LPS export ABC transporter periplasmic protein LptC [Betaproteobacteria bacterium]MBK9675398.1 LPS export ABC transporter periplasmic protein LptC [Betaproteobacteria bacterium]
MAIDRTKLLLDRLITWSPVLLLGSLAALTYWLDAQIQPPAPRVDGSSRHDPDLFVEKFRATSFDVEGRPRQALSAQRAEHFPDDKTIALKGLALSITDPNRAPLSVFADRGVVSGDRETMSLEGSVRGVREAEPTKAGQPRDGSGRVTLSTEYLRVVPKKGLAETDRPVTIEEPRGIIHSVGIQLDNEAKTIKLKSGVRGTLQPNTIAK